MRLRYFLAGAVAGVAAVAGGLFLACLVDELTRDRRCRAALRERGW